MDYSWEDKSIGNEIKYSANAILFSFSILRVYVLIKVVRYYSFFTDEKSKRMLEFFKIRNVYYFVYKANIKANGFISLILIFCSLLYLSGLIFKVYEDYIPGPEDDRTFSDLANCLWYLVVTMTTSNL